MLTPIHLAGNCAVDVMVPDAIGRRAKLRILEAEPSLRCQGERGVDGIMQHVPTNPVAGANTVEAGDTFSAGLLRIEHRICRRRTRWPLRGGWHPTSCALGARQSG